MHVYKRSLQELKTVPAAAPKGGVIRQAGVVLGVSALLAFGTPAQANPDLELGEAVFSQNCATCHTGGNNILMVRIFSEYILENLNKYLLHSWIL